jgi:hypothetical protein
MLLNNVEESKTKGSPTMFTTIKQSRLATIAGCAVLLAGCAVLLAGLTVSAGAPVRIAMAAAAADDMTVVASPIVDARGQGRAELLDTRAHAGSDPRGYPDRGRPGPGGATPGARGARRVGGAGAPHVRAHCHRHRRAHGNSRRGGPER